MLVFRGIPEIAKSPVALTIGNFDGVHLGHRAVLRRLIEQARKLGVPSCVVTFEPHPREFFDPQNAPARLTDLREKLALLAEYGIDRVHVLRFDAALAAMPASDFISRFISRGLNAKWVLIGDDFRFGARRQGDFEMMRQAGIALDFEVESMHSVRLADSRISSTGVRDALKSGELELAKQLLGRNYSIAGRVIHGEKLGGRIGYPTANIRLKHNRPPLSGVFVVEAHGIGETAIPGVASLGVRPTIVAGGNPVLEAHLFDFDGNLYGKRLQIDFLLKLREEAKFPNLEALVAQIGQDALDARRYFAQNHT